MMEGFLQNKIKSKKIQSIQKKKKKKVEEEVGGSNNKKRLKEPVFSKIKIIKFDLKGLEIVGLIYINYIFIKIMLLQSLYHN